MGPDSPATPERSGPSGASQPLSPAPRGARRLGLSRGEYVRRRLAQDAATGVSPVTAGDLQRFAADFGDLADPEVMSRAWQ